MLVGASYKRFTCPNPTNRLSVKAGKTVNVCLRVAHRPGKADRLTLIWERNGSLSGKTHLAIPASRTNIRTRAKMRISAKRLGAWSVRVVSDRNAPLAETTFDVVPLKPAAQNAIGVGRQAPDVGIARHHVLDEGELVAPAQHRPARQQGALCDTPSEICTTSARPGTGVGVDRLVVVPSPSSPWTLYPQHETVRSASSAQT